MYIYIHIFQIYIYICTCICGIYVYVSIVASTTQMCGPGGEFSEGIFITLVVLSQIGLFVCSSVASKMAGFHSEDQAQGKGRGDDGIYIHAQYLSMYIHIYICIYIYIISCT